MVVPYQFAKPIFIDTSVKRWTLRFIYDDSLSLSVVPYNLTRKENIFDLYFTNSPTLVRQMEMIPGIGDHDSAIKVDSMINPMVSQCKPKKIYQFHKGDMTALKADLKDFQGTFLANCDGKSVEELWLSFHSQ